MTFAAFLRRLRKIAERTLESYGLGNCRPEFINYSGNGLYRIKVKSGHGIPAGRYALRIHQPNYMKPGFITAEMNWLEALGNSGASVPRPVRNTDNEWITVTDLGYDVPQKRNCTLVGWTEGRLLNKGVRPRHFKSLGRVIGLMHNQSRSWKPPSGFSRPHWDYEGLVGDGFSYGVPAKDVHAAIPKKLQSVFSKGLAIVNEAVGQMSKSKKYYGLIHADLGLGSNIAFDQGMAKPFDFDDCGFGYWIFDFGVLLSQYILDHQDMSDTMRTALLEGYSETALTEDIGLEFLDAFIVARIVQLIFFLKASSMANPQFEDEAKREMNEHAIVLKRLLKRFGN